MGGYDSLIELFVIKDAYGERTFLEMPKQLVEIRGLAMPPLDHRTIRSPFQHGELYLGFSLRPRPVQIVMHVEGCDRLDMWYKRRELIQQMNPLLGRLRLQVHFRDHTIYELHEVTYDAGFDVGTDGQAGPSIQAFAARFMAYDPVWFKHPENILSAVLVVTSELTFHIREEPGWGAGITFHIEFPLIFAEPLPPEFVGNGIIFPIIFGATMILEEFNVTTVGNWISYPTFVLTGPLRDPVISNTTTGEKLELTYKVMDGEVVTITTEFGNKTVFNEGGDNLLGYLTTDSDLATFHLDPHPLAEDGVNVIKLEATECFAASAMTVLWHDRYLGL